MHINKHVHGFTSIRYTNTNNIGNIDLKTIFYLFIYFLYYFI